MEFLSTGCFRWNPNPTRILCLDLLLEEEGAWDEQCDLKISCWSEASERLSSDFLLPLEQHKKSPLIVVPVVVDEFILLVEFVDRFTGYPFGRATQRYIIKTVENLVHVADPYCFQLIENCPIQKSIGPFFVDPLIRTSLESLVAPKASHEENLIWNGPISLNFCLTLFSTTGPPSCLFSAASRPVQLLLTPLASTPIQLLSSLSFSSIPPLLSHYSNAWIQNLLFGACSLVVRDVKLSENLQLLFREKTLFICGRLSWFDLQELPSHLSDLNAAAGPVSYLGAISGAEGLFSSDVELKRPPIRCECGSLNCADEKCKDCGTFKPNTSSPLFLLLSLCVIIPRRHSNPQSTGAIARRRSLFGRDRVSNSAVPKKSLAESLVVWNLCTGIVPLESLVSPSGSFEVEFETFGITAEDTSTFYPLDSARPNSQVAIDPWCRPAAPSWSESTRKQRREVVGNIVLKLSSLFDSSNDLSGGDLIESVRLQLAESDYQQALLSLSGIEPSALRDHLPAIHVSDRVSLLSHLSEEVNTDSLTLSLECSACVVEEIVLSLLSSPEMGDQWMEMILMTLLAKECCHSALLFMVETWLQANTFAELIADPLLAAGSLPPSSDPSEELILLKKEKWLLSFAVCWCVKFLAFEFPSPGLSSKYDLVVLGVNLVQSILRFGVVVISEWRHSAPLDAILPFQLPLEILRPIDVLLPLVVEHDHNFSPSSLELFFSFVCATTTASASYTQSPSVRRFIEGVCLVLTKAEGSSSDLSDLLPNLHPRRRADQAGYSLRVSGAKKTDSPSSFSLWNAFHSSSSRTNDLLHFFRSLRETFSSLHIPTKRIVASLLKSLVHSLFLKLKTLPSDIASVPPIIRKRIPLQQLSGRPGPVSLVSTTLQGIIERGEALPHLNPVDIFVLFVGLHAEEIVALLSLAMTLGAAGTSQTLTPQSALSEKPPPQKTTGEPVTTHEDRMNRAPVDGRVSVRTGKRLVGSTITRRLLGHSSAAKKKPEEPVVLEIPKSVLDEDAILGVLASCRLVLDSLDASLRANDGRSAAPSLVPTFSAIFSGASANLAVTHRFNEEHLERYFVSILDREFSRVSACYETLRIYLLLVQTSHQGNNKPSPLLTETRLRWLPSDFRRVADLMAVSSSLSTSDPFLSLNASSQVISCDDLLERRVLLLQHWGRSWLQIILTATSLCRSSLPHLCRINSRPCLGLEEQFLQLLQLLEAHCRFEGIRGAVLLLRDEETSDVLSQSRVEAVVHLLSVIEETSTRVSRSRRPSRRSSTHTQNHEFYRLLSQSLQLQVVSSATGFPQNSYPDYSQLLRLSLFRCCLNIASAPAPSPSNESTAVTESEPIPSAAPEILWRLSDVFVDSVDKWLALSLPPSVPPLHSLSPEDDHGPARDHHSLDIPELFSCLKLALKGMATTDPALSHPLSELINRVHHCFKRWSAYVSTFTEPLASSLDLCISIGSLRTASPHFLQHWTTSLRVAATASFLDNAIARASSVRSLLSFFGTVSGNAFQDETESEERRVGLFPSSEAVSESLLRLAWRRAERFRDLSLQSSSTPSLPLSGAALFAFCQSNGIRCERHHQEVRELLVSLLGAGYWELGERISKAYIEEYRETAKGARKEGKAILSSSINGVQDRLSTLMEELDRVTDKFQDRLLHEGDARPRPLYFAVRFLESPWKAAGAQEQELHSKFAEFFDITDFSMVDLESHQPNAFAANHAQLGNSMSLAGIGPNELWVLLKIDPQSFLESSAHSPLVIDEIEQSHGPVGSESRLIHQLESAFPDYVILSSAALYPFNRNPIDPTLTANSATPFLPFSSKVAQVFRAHPNISFDSDQALLKSFLQHVSAGTSAPSSRRSSTTSNPHLRRASVSSPGGIMDFTRRRRQKNLSAYSSILGRPPLQSSEASDSRRISLLQPQPGDFFPMLLDSEATNGEETDLSVWEVYSYCDSFVIHTELSEELDEIEKDDCVSTVTIVLKTSLSRNLKGRHPHAADVLEDPLEILLENRNATVPYRLCLLSSVFIFPSVLSHAYCLLRHQLRAVLHCYELLQACSSADHGEMLVNDICHTNTILLYATSLLLGLVSEHRNCVGKKPFSLENSSELISGEGERRNILWQHRRRQLKREIMTKRSEEAESQPEMDIAEMEAHFLRELDETEANYLQAMGISFGESDDVLQNPTIDNLYETVVELNIGLKTSVAATISLFKKVCSKLRLGNKEPEKRSQRKGSQDAEDLEEAGDPKVTQWVQISLFLEREFRALL